MAFAVPILAAASCRDGPRTAAERPPVVATRGGVGVAAPVLTWVAPLGTGAADSATFDRTAAPAVEICAWTGTACDGPPVARFAVAPARGELALRVNDAAGNYEAAWLLADPRLVTRRTYRVRVLWAGAELGALSVDAVRGYWAPAGGAPGALAPLQPADTLPVRFHLARAAPEWLTGAPNAPAGPSIPDLTFVPRAVDYSISHPQLAGMPVAFDVLWLTFKPGVTVGQANALLSEIRAVIAGGVRGTPTVSGILVLRVPTTTHAQMIALLARLRADPRVARAVQDVLLSPDVVSPPSADVPRGDSAWTWAVAPGGGNWGLESIRAPQLWALNGAVCKVLRRTARATDCAHLDPRTLGADVPATGVLDGGFAPNHLDLMFAANQTAKRWPDYHGTHVAGIIGARFDNHSPQGPQHLQSGVGVDGVNPFARLVVRAVNVGEPATPTGVLNPGEAFESVIADFAALVQATPNVRVVNVSLGYKWASRGINSRTNEAARTVASNEGAIFAAQYALLAARGVRMPAVFATAGNDGGVLEPGPGEARWNSPLTNAAIEHGLAAVTVVESDSLVLDGSGRVIRSQFSNRKGHVSAPGSQILSTHIDHCPPGNWEAWRSACSRWHRGAYALESGTSFATPHAAGLAGYLTVLARLYGPGAPDRLAPTVSQATVFGVNPIRKLLEETSTYVDNAARQIDAFSAALELDVVLGGDLILRGLVDVDDGTPDGNRRTNADGTDFLNEDADRDGGVGDGRVDMRDFRRWRDWLLAAERAPGLALDGDLRHPKRDVNGNHRFAPDDTENVYPRGDFNGDGVLSRTKRREVWGVMKHANATDLEVLQQLFDDPNYQKEQLPGLIESADLTVDPGVCFRDTKAARVRVRVSPRGGSATAPGAQVRVVARADSDSVQVFTVPVRPGGYAVGAEALADAAGRVLATADAEFARMPLGSDTQWAPPCIVDVPGGTQYWMGTWSRSAFLGGGRGSMRLTVRAFKSRPDALGARIDSLTGWQDIADARGVYYARIAIRGIVVVNDEHPNGEDGFLQWEYDGVDGQHNEVVVFPDTTGGPAKGQHSVTRAGDKMASELWDLRLARTTKFAPPGVLGPAPAFGPPPQAAQQAARRR